ncbi:hypothetical protein O181_106466 [Austropuccinia psidii MF-1]|uniref:Uncharacterized protein n=1 Tax=Austropuccinia psidii MF-1 TaxID=1389203 RepID=A0A9Q3PNA0_9BASI|nr:hypothetical protein [Austropuccinia psidii MF-1]
MDARTQTGRQEQFQTISPVPQASICPPPLLGHHPMVTSLLDRSEVIIQPMKDGNGKRTFELGPIVTMSCHPWDSNTNVNPPQQYSPVPSLPCKQTPQQPTPANPPEQMSHLFLARVHPLNHMRTFRPLFLTFPSTISSLSHSTPLRNHH